MIDDRVYRTPKVLFEVQDIKMYFPIKKKSIFQKQEYVKANDGINLTIYEGETLGLVGESGCGKSTFGRVLLQLYHQTKGNIIYYKLSSEGGAEVGIHLEHLTEKEMRGLRKDLQMVFQDPYSSLNPRMTVGQLIGEGVFVHGLVKKRDELVGYVKEVMEACGLDGSMMNRYPHQFSGGQRQRIGIARCIALHPRFIVCDEAVSALDVSIQAQIINLLTELKRKEKLTYLFISHDLGVVRYISDRIGVMYLGRLVELSTCEELFVQPLHPYTKVLLSAIPSVEQEKEQRMTEKEERTNAKEDVVKKVESIGLSGELPSPIHPPNGCAYHTRCQYRTEACKEKVPELREYSVGHWIACHHIK